MPVYPSATFARPQVAPTYSNSHSVINAAFKVSLSAPPTNGSAGPSQASGRTMTGVSVVLGYPGASSWVCHRAAGAEEALLGGWMADAANHRLICCSGGGAEGASAVCG
jgi:hypothetical protein